MASIDIRFSGSVPANYERYMVPLLFQPYAEILAERAAQFAPRQILETAAGTGVVTAALARALPEAEIIATDLNQAMLDVAAKRVSSDSVSFRQADALDLPFEDESFDLVVCQFGVMFYPDKVRGNAEARRVLRDGGRYLLAIWDGMDRNPLSELAHQTMERRFPDNPPMFLQRGPFSYHDAHWIERDLERRRLCRHCDRNGRADEPQRFGRRCGARPGLRFADAGRARGIWPRSARPRLRRPGRGRSQV